MSDLVKNIDLYDLEKVIKRLRDEFPVNHNKYHFSNEEEAVEEAIEMLESLKNSGRL